MNPQKGRGGVGVFEIVCSERKISLIFIVLAASQNK